VNGACDDCVHFASERQTDGFLHRFAGDPPRLFWKQGAGSGTRRCIGRYRSPLPAPEKHENRVERTER